LLDSQRGFYNSLIRISSDTYAIAYQGYSHQLGNYGGQLKIVSIPEDGSEVKVLSQWTFDHGSSGWGDWNSLVKVDDNTFALAYSGGSSEDGTIKTFTISDEGSSITEVAVLVHDTGIGNYNSFVHVKGNTFALAYTGTGNDGYIKTFTIPTDGSTITQVQSLEHATYWGGYNSLVKVDYNTYALAYSGGTSTYTNSYYYGFLKTFTIPLDGSSITQVKSFQNNTTNNIGSYQSLIKINSEEYALAYAGDGNDGFIDNFTISSDGDSIKKVWSLEHDTDNGLYNSLIMVDKDTYALAYGGSNNDGFIKTFNGGTSCSNIGGF